MNQQNKAYKFYEDRKNRILAQRLAGVEVDKIALKEGMTKGRIYQILREKGWRGRKAQQPPAEAPHVENI